MNRLKKINSIRRTLKNNEISVGSWIQLPHSSVAEIMGNSGYDWVAVDLEHGSVSHHQLPDLFRAIELGNTLPLVRLAQCDSRDCKMALDAGAGGVIVPMIETAQQLVRIRDACRWPPAGLRGVGFSRANLFGRYFQDYRDEAQAPLLVAMIEHIKAVDRLEEILEVKGLDAIFIGPYDLSASMGITGEFELSEFCEVMEKIRRLCKKFNVPSGMHIIHPSQSELSARIEEGYQFIAYSLDSVMLSKAANYRGLVNGRED
jgi:2-dehydro-3-deoxyglucarate aldolase